MLIRQILEKQDDDSFSEITNSSIEQVIMSSWFMKPFKGSSDTKIGSLNERNVFDNIDNFLHNNTKYALIEKRGYGLLQHKHQKEGRFSPDGILVLKDKSASSEEYTFFCGLEIKTRTSPKTVQLEYDVVTSLNATFCEVNVGDPS